MFYKNVIKRIMDLVIAFIALILLFPIFLIVFIALTISNNGKPLFFQIRPGKNEKLFKIVKFKTMNDKKDAQGNFLDFDKRVTKLGKFVRKYSLDEIPQLFNVLKGDMSLIGPRPLMVEYLPLYNDTQKRRHEVKPGITGWAQVNGRNAILWVKKFEYDVWYVENISLVLDIKILLLTIKKVIFKDGVNSSESLNMTTFTGGNNE
ncbi:sugar transferase [Confluentibacter flavum]|uniref:Lipid carrier--UDP-N-acetylgalactosaminyltransferase n=1 Tax=Confluentibacter flavum TaxID=1909700 RepID=A0A2N3HGR4_9FLAO|nr:sugar transferase [Confluentibacter flavum]PKQ44156.1 lipid carrier--UDP-N-acetylgalactosaminyltransferase [Confluentibacter flavum]